MDFSLIAEPRDRIKRMKKRHLDRTPCLCCQRAEIVTEIWQKHEELPPILRRSLSFLECAKRMDIFIEEEELLMGHHASRPRSCECFPETFMNYIDELDDFETRTCNRLKVSQEVKETLRRLAPYWEGKNSESLFRALRLPEAVALNEVGALTVVGGDRGLGHMALEYSKLINLGVEGILAELNEYDHQLSITQPGYYEKHIFYTASKTVLEGLVVYANRLSELAEKAALKETDGKRRKELFEMARITKKVPLHKADTFWEAMQSLSMLHFMTGFESYAYSMSPSRFDQYMYPFYQADIESGRITVEDAQELIDNFFLKMCEVVHVSNEKGAVNGSGYALGEMVCVGGVDKDGNDAANELSYLCLAANRHLALNQPNLAARIHSGMPDLYLQKVIESIAVGNGMPEILNDDLIIKGLQKKGIPIELARDYWPLGCDEVTFKGYFSRCNGGYVNMAKILELTMGGGSDLMLGREVGLRQNVDSVKTFDEFLSLFKEQLSYAVKIHCADTNLADYINRERGPLPLASTFMDGCIQKGKDLTDGGAWYGGTTVIGCGTANCADGLCAIKELVFDKQELTLSEFREILRRNYNKNEFLRQKILNKIPKYGNDIDEVDDLVVMITNTFFDELDKYKTYRGDNFWAALYSVTSQVALGYMTAAGADGRLSGTPLADGMTPMYGQDKNGPTATLKSFTKLDLGRALGGVIINQRFTKAVFQNESNREKLAQLFKVFCKMGGFHWQFNIISNETMRAAQEHPEKYMDLVVRVAGYSAQFIELSKDAQDSVIMRTAADI